MDYMDLDVSCTRKAVQLKSLTHVNFCYIFPFSLSALAGSNKSREETSIK